MITKIGLQERLLIVRKSTRLSQADFGASLGLSDRAYKNYELGIRKLPLDVLLDIAQKYETSIEWLITGEGSRSPPTTGEAVEAAVIAVREHFLATGKTPSLEKEAVIIRYVFEQILHEGGLNPERLAAYFRTV